MLTINKQFIIKALVLLCINLIFSIILLLVGIYRTTNDEILNNCFFGIGLGDIIGISVAASLILREIFMHCRVNIPNHVFIIYIGVHTVIIFALAIWGSILASENILLGYSMIGVAFGIFCSTISTIILFTFNDSNNLE